MTTFLVLAVVLVIATFFYMRQAKFGQAPTAKHLEQISRSSNFKDGMFKNLEYTPDLTEGYSYLGILYDQFFGNHPRTKPRNVIPSEKTDLFSIPEDENILVWFGHSSYFIQLDEKKILVDPVFSGNASPVPGTVKSFPGTDIYTVEDIPEIDYLLISHDHYDHLDYKTIKGLKEKVSTVICGLGVGSHFHKWGYDTSQILEQDWFDKIEVDSGYTIHTTPTRHFSGRGFSRKNTLWASFVIEAPSHKIYIGGDSGYGEFFTEIRNRIGEMDLVILDNGQYNNAWKEIHMHPDQVLQAAHDLKARRLFPVHSSKFVLAMHPWDEPLNEVSRLNQQNSNPISLFIPQIGEKVNLDDSNRIFERWWEEVD
ncbi:MAG TPA: MBL fold metallo-hydrolase [Balneola sp.]|nr:MBL fold metallo-hydrolase [Balneola sp.]